MNDVADITVSGGKTAAAEPKVLLVSPASRAFNHYRPPLGLLYLSGYLKKHGVDAQVIDILPKEQVKDSTFRRNYSKYKAQIEDEIIEIIEQNNADIVGISCCSPELEEVEKFAKRVRAVKPEARIIAGGIHPTLYPEHFIGPSSDFDFVVIGEGEVTLHELVVAIRSNKENGFRNIAGIGYYDLEEKRNIITPARTVAVDLDSLACLDFKDLDMEYYTTAEPYAIRGVLIRAFYLSASRGCPSSCTFCVSKKLRDYHGVRNYTRLRSASSLLSEVMELRNRHGIDGFYFIDDLFTMKKSNVMEFCRLLVESNLNLVWGCSSRVNTVDYEMLKAMRDSGCIQIDFGVEKGSDKALAAVNKGVTVEQIKKTFGFCRDLGIRTLANILSNTPGEEEKDLDDMLRLLDEIKPTIVYFNVFIPYPGCEIFDSLRGSITRQDYHLLMQNIGKLINEKPAMFRFSAHSVDLEKWSLQNTRKYNRFFENMKIYFNPKYLRALLGSKHKSNYFIQSWAALREFVVQKF